MLSTTIKGHRHRAAVEGTIMAGMTIPEMKEMARKCRIEICKMTHRAQAGHPGGSLSEIDILCGLYGHRLRVKPDDPDWEDRDRFILSKGHASPGMSQFLLKWDLFPMKI